MKKIIIILTLITLYILIFNSCKKPCESKNLGTVKFTSEDLKIVPYKGTETLTFLDSLGNKLTYKGDDRVRLYNNEHHEFSSSGNDECTGNYFYSEINDTRFKGNDLYFFIWVDLLMDDGNPFNKNIKKSIEIKVVYEDTKIWIFDGYFNFNAMKLYNHTDTSESNLTLKDSLMIGLKKYYSVYVLKQNNTNIKTLFYIIKEGIVGFRTKEGHTWYLNN
jgi:hypothetical protein